MAEKARTLADLVTDSDQIINTESVRPVPAETGESVKLRQVLFPRGQSVNIK